MPLFARKPTLTVALCFCCYDAFWVFEHLDFFFNLLNCLNFSNFFMNTCLALFFFLNNFLIYGYHYNWFSAPPPPLQAGTFSRGVVTMRCDVTTCSCAHISLLVSGSAQTCFDDQVIRKNLCGKVLVLEMLDSYTL